MKRILILLAAGSLLSGFGAPAAPGSSSSAEGYISAASHSVETILFDWVDAKRDRKVPAKIYLPTGQGPFPVVLFSHGLGGSREGYSYLGEYWASHGYVSVHVQHPGSDDSVWSQKPRADVMKEMRKAAANIENASNRPLDVSFAIDQLEKLNQSDPQLKGRLDLSRLGVAGHSFGAFTTLAIAGQVFAVPRGKELTFGDPRVKAAIPMSAPVVQNKANLKRAYSQIKIHCLHMTGTDDSSPIGDTKPAERRLPYDYCNGADQYLLTLKNGDHMIFGGRTTHLKPEAEKLYVHFICESSTAFWDAYLQGDAKAKAWLAKGGFKQELGSNGTFEEKSPR